MSARERIEKRKTNRKEVSDLFFAGLISLGFPIILITAGHLLIG